MIAEADSFHRLMKALLDSAEVNSIEEAEEVFRTYGAAIHIGDDFAKSIADQIIGLTAINVASRSFIGNIAVVGDEDCRLSAPGYGGVLLSEFCGWLGVAMNTPADPTWPEIVIGSRTSPPPASNKLRPWAEGWAFGLGECSIAGEPFFPPACVAAGALAVSEVFSLLRKDNAYAGRRALSFSLWTMSAGSEQPPLNLAKSNLLSDLWLVGGGHLGQAYAWTLGFMAGRGASRIYVQDYDKVTKSTLSTSVVSGNSDIEELKADVVSRWLEARGFKTKRIVMPFDRSIRVTKDDPSFALFGVDNAAARRACEGVGFRKVIDVGLGSGYKDFRAIRLRAFPGATPASELWSADAVPLDSSAAPAYQKLLKSGADRCGVTTLGTRAVGAPFVGCYAAGLLIGELARLNLGQNGFEVVNVNLRDPARSEVVW